MASIGQYALPLICIAAGFAATLGRRSKRAARVARDATTLIESMSRREFDKLIAEAFRLQGYQLVENPTRDSGPTAAVDLVLRKDRETVYVDCRSWRAARVGVEVIRALHAVMVLQRVAGGFVVTSGRFSRQAAAFAQGCNIKLIDGPIVHGLIVKAQMSRAAAMVRPNPAAPV